MSVVEILKDTEDVEKKNAIICNSTTWRESLLILFSYIIGSTVYILFCNLIFHLIYSNISPYYLNVLHIHCL